MPLYNYFGAVATYNLRESLVRDPPLKSDYWDYLTGDMSLGTVYLLYAVHYQSRNEVQTGTSSPCSFPVKSLRVLLGLC